ncbi:MAG: phosphatase PAP2 family protein [Planctomycetota bacterium]|nr:phosphatase PAP2 family protein [Planctomycetota bacterium]
MSGMKPDGSLRCWPGYLVPSVALVAVFALAANLIAGRSGFRLDLSPAYAPYCLAVYAGTMLFWSVFFLAFRVVGEDLRLKRREGLNLSLPALTRRVLAPYALGRTALEVLAAIVLFHAATVIHTNLQQRVPAINLAIHDAVFAWMDRGLGLGNDPVAALAGSRLFSASVVARFFDLLYVSWYFVKLPLVAYFLLAADRQMSHAFLFAFLLMWVAHIAIVLTLPSLGPVFVTPEVFAGLNMPAAHSIQATVWTGYRHFLANPMQYRVHMYEGMSAFPSLHVGLVALYALFLSGTRARVRWAAWIYVLLMLIGSCVTGWHYLVDGIAGLGMAAVVSVFSRWLFKGSSERQGA